MGKLTPQMINRYFWDHCKFDVPLKRVIERDVDRGQGGSVRRQQIGDTDRTIVREHNRLA